MKSVYGSAACPTIARFLHGTIAVFMWPLWLIWGALTDWVEQRPAETEQAESAMARAAQEWLSLPENADGQRAYFDRWLYDELGYERPQHAEPGAAADRGGM